VLGCEVARRRTVVAAGGLRLSWLAGGASGRPPVLLLHGGAAHAHWFDAVLPALIERFHVVALDQRGHGESAWAAPPAYATEDFAGDLLAVLDHLGWARASLVGHSMGGHNALAFAAWHPGRVGALVVLDARPSVPPERLGQMRERGLRRTRLHPSLDDAVAAFRLLPPDTVADPALLAHLAREGVVARAGGVVYRFDPACYAARQPVDLWPLLPRIAAPALVVRGERSPILPREMAERLRAALGRATLVEVPEAYHHVLLDRPAAVARTLIDFLTDVEATA
jgi:pimeloyl-ACP methyl ester carboxylesterase